MDFMTNKVERHFFHFKVMHLEILFIPHQPHVFLFASDYKSCRRACGKANPLLAKKKCFRRSCIVESFSDHLLFFLFPQ